MIMPINNAVIIPPLIKDFNRNLFHEVDIFFMTLLSVLFSIFVFIKKFDHFCDPFSFKLLLDRFFPIF